MKYRAMTCAFALIAGLATAGGAYAQSTGRSSPPTSPSTTPNDGAAVPPNTKVPPGQIPPAPNAAPNTGTTPPNLDKSGHMKSGKQHGSEMPNRKREANDNVPNTPAGGAAPPPGYPNTGGSK